MNAASPPAVGPRILGLLALAYILNFVDRNVIGVLAVPIRAEFGLSDTALSVLGVAFGIFYAVIAVPIARLADRGRRVDVVSGAIAVWSIFTAVCGLAQGYAQLVAARIGVAFGEAGAIAPSHALISDYFPHERRSRALALFSLGIPIGSALGIFFGGWLASALSWRSAFIILGIVGLPLALVVRLYIPEPQRGALDEQPSSTPVPLRAVTAALSKIPSFWLMSVGAALGSIPGYGLIFWLPSLFNRSFGLPVDQVGFFYGSVMLVGGVAGTWLGGWLGDRLGPARPAAYAIIPAVSLLSSVPLYAAGIFASSLPIAWVLLSAAQMMSLLWLGPVFAAVQQLVLPSMRATASATFLLVNNLIGIAGGIYVLGWLSEAMKTAYGTDSLRYSVLFSLAFYLLSGAVYLLASIRLPQDMRR
ncbi:MAG: spinster family MFS transporter [Sphingomicrobium sp.]